MKKILLAVALMSLASVSSFALSITQTQACNPAAVSNAGTCTLNFGGFGVVTTPPYTISSLDFNYFVDYTFTAGNGPSSNLTLNINSPVAGLTNEVFDVNSRLVNTSGSGGALIRGNSSSNVSSNSAGFIANYLSAFSTGVSFTSTNVTDANISVTYTINYDLTPTQTGVPEPSTVALMGAGLVAVATFARRKR